MNLKLEAVTLSPQVLRLTKKCCKVWRRWVVTLSSFIDEMEKILLE